MVIEDILRSAFEAVLKQKINATYYTGTEAMVSQKLKDMPAAERYPLIAPVTPIFERTDSNSGFVTIRMPRLVFGTKTCTTDTPMKRLEVTFKMILIPVYESYMSNLAKQAGVIDRDWHLWPKEKFNSYGETPATDKVCDVLDAIEIRDLIFRVNQNICC